MVAEAMVMPSNSTPLKGIMPSPADEQFGMLELFDRVGAVCTQSGSAGAQGGASILELCESSDPILIMQEDDKLEAALAASKVGDLQAACLLLNECLFHEEDAYSRYTLELVLADWYREQGESSCAREYAYKAVKELIEGDSYGSPLFLPFMALAFAIFATILDQEVIWHLSGHKYRPAKRAFDDADSLYRHALRILEDMRDEQLAATMRPLYLYVCKRYAALLEETEVLQTTGRDKDQIMQLRLTHELSQAA